MSRARGNRGEAMAKKYLLEQGYEILHSNYYSPYGEIDLIAQKDETLIFVEVKSRATEFGTYGTAEESVTPVKQKRFLKTMYSYLQEQDIDDTIPIRCDLIVLYTNAQKLRHYHNAFS